MKGHSTGRLPLPKTTAATAASEEGWRVQPESPERALHVSWYCQCKPLWPKHWSVCSGEIESLILRPFHQECRVGGCVQTMGAVDRKNNAAAHPWGPQRAFEACVCLNSPDGQCWPWRQIWYLHDICFYIFSWTCHLGRYWTGGHSQECKCHPLRWSSSLSTMICTVWRTYGFNLDNRSHWKDPDQIQPHLHVTNTSSRFMGKKTQCTWYPSMCIH